MNALKHLRYFTTVVNIVVLAFVATACNYQSSAAVDDGLDKVITLLEKSDRDNASELLKTAQDIKESQKNNFTNLRYQNVLRGKFDNSDPAKATQWVADNKEAILSIVAQMDTGIQADIKEVSRLSKEAYNDQDAESAVWKYSLVYFKLQYFRGNIRKALEAVSPLTLIIHSPALEKDAGSLEFRKSLEAKMLTMMGVGIVLDQDYQEVKNIIAKYNQEAAIPTELKKVLVKTDKNVLTQMDKHAKKLKTKNTACQDYPEQCAKFKELKQQIKEEYKKITFLYTPGQKYFTITKVLTVIGNLTWGLVNTIIGVGIVLATMLVSPLSPYVDFPTFNIAANGMQIYVDATNMFPGRYKLSMGLFEFSNNMGYDSHSLHEGGHAIQSAALGPLYLPVVLLTYVISGFDEGLMENMADDFARGSNVWI